MASNTSVTTRFMKVLVGVADVRMTGQQCAAGERCALTCVKRRAIQPAQDVQPAQRMMGARDAEHGRVDGECRDEADPASPVASQRA